MKCWGEKCAGLEYLGVLSALGRAPGPRSWFAIRTVLYSVVTLDTATTVP